MSRDPMAPVDGAGQHHVLPPGGPEGKARDTRAEGQASVPDLLRRLSGEGADLVRQEISLAKAEMEEKLETMKRGAATMAVGGGIMLAALLFALWALNTGVTTALLQVVDAEIAVWLAPLLLAAVLFAIGWGMISSGRSTMAEEGLAPEQTTESLRNDGRWAENKAKQAKAEITR